MQPGLILAFTLVIAVSACVVSTHAARIDPSIHLARTCAEGVKLFKTDTDIQANYTEVALLTAKAETKESNDGDMIEAMRKKAGNVGANGVILKSLREPGALTQIAGEMAKTGTLRKGESIAVFIPEDSARVRLACSGKRSDGTAAERRPTF